MHRKLAFSVVFKTNNPAATWGPQPETVRDYLVEGRVGGQWVLLCNVTGNYQRRRVHTLPCSPPEPAPPVPRKPVVASGSVTATYCNVTSPAQRWRMEGNSSTGGGVVVRSGDGKLCLGFDANTSAFGGHGNSVVARPCGASPTSWVFSQSEGGSFLRTALTHATCSGYPGQHQACECAHPVSCAACHGTEEYTPPTSVELWLCTPGSHMKWSALQVLDGQDDGRNMLLMTGGLCLQAPADQRAVFDSPAPRQRVQPKDERDEEEAAPVVVSDVRVTVTATNGIADARINEVRLYDANGLAPFPKQPTHGT